MCSSIMYKRLGFLIIWYIKVIENDEASSNTFLTMNYCYIKEKIIYDCHSPCIKLINIRDIEEKI